MLSDLQRFLLIQLNKRGPLRSDEFASVYNGKLQAEAGHPSKVAASLLGVRDNCGYVSSTNDGARYNLWTITDKGRAALGASEEQPRLSAEEELALKQHAEWAPKIRALCDEAVKQNLGAPGECVLDVLLRALRKPDAGEFYVARVQREHLDKGRRFGTYEAALANAQCKAATRSAEGFVYEVVEVRARAEYVPPIPATTKVEEF